jgi:hypothetical protein
VNKGKDVLCVETDKKTPPGQVHGDFQSLIGSRRKEPKNGAEVLMFKAPVQKIQKPMIRTRPR